MAQQGKRTIDTGVMIGVSHTVGEQCSLIENCLNDIIKGASSLKSEWEGESANAYQTAIEKISEYSPTVVEILRKYSQDLSAIAAEFKTTDGSIKTQSEALPSVFTALGG